MAGGPLVDCPLVSPDGAPPIDQAPGLLAEMLDAARRQPALYQPGPYWRAKTEAAVRQISRHGLEGFRGEESGLGTSYADNLFTDVRSTLDTRRGRPIKFLLERLWPFSAVFDSQVALTRGYARDEIRLRAARMRESDAARSLVERYKIKNSLLGGCVGTTRIKGQEYSLHHLRTLQLIDRVSRHVNLESVHAVFEIGGGFGALVQLLIDNFSAIRKVVYLDVVPNLYVGTCYLRTLFGAAVRDFSETSPLARISFRDTDTLEILAIAPWQIERLDLSIDLFWNSNSFVEMPPPVTSNYARHVLSLSQPNTAGLVLSTYGGGEANTLSPQDLPALFPNREFTNDQYRALDHPERDGLGSDRDATWETYLFVSAGQHTASTYPVAAPASTSD